MEIIRKINNEDIKQISAIEQEEFSDSWEEQGFLELLSQDHIYGYAAIERDEVRGYLILSCVFDEAEVLNIAVSGKYKRQGTAKRLFAYAFSQAKTLGAAVVLLEVREQNGPAICFYEKYGFEKIGIRKNLYDKPKENGIVMIKSI